MRAVRGAEGVVHENVSHGSELLGELGVVLGLALFKAGVLKQHDLAVLEGGGQRLCALAHDVLGHLDRLAQQLGQTVGHDLQAQLRLHFALGLAHVGAEDDAGIVLHEILDGRQRGDDALVARDLPVLGGDVKVAAAKDALARDVDIFNRLLVVVHRCSSLFDGGGSPLVYRFQSAIFPSVFRCGNCCCRSASNTPMAAELLRLRLRASARMGMRTQLS